MPRALVGGVCLALAFTASPLLAQPSDRPAPVTAAAADLARGARNVADYLPTGFVRDGSVGYQAELQRAIDDAARDGLPLLFPAMTYRLDATGLELRSRSTLWMHGARFDLDRDARQDGQAFFGRDLSAVRIVGGEIVGHNDVWPAGVNIRGIHLTGASRDVRIEDVRMHDLSSNGIGVFASPDAPARDVWVIDVVVEHCCNVYGDYLAAKRGPEPGSVREDQGSICCYDVQDFVVRGCRFESSRSDGTHFFRCRRGQFTDNRVYGAKMGGYFLETCHDVIAAGNVIRDNGSRGVTIERGSTNCTLQNCVVAASGREGLWAPDCVGLVVCGNVFERNGRKAADTKDTKSCNVCVNTDSKDRAAARVADYLIADNLFYTDPFQIAAIRVDAAVATQIVIKNNLLRGDNRAIRVDGEAGDRVIVQGNVP